MAKPYSQLAEDYIEDVWKDDPEASAATITERVNLNLADYVDPRTGQGTDERVKNRAVGTRIAEFKKVYEPLAPDPIVHIWADDSDLAPNKTREGNWPTDPDDIKTLMILYHEADSIIPLASPEPFVGLTDRLVKWALRIQKFFNHAVPRDRVMHLFFAVLFTDEERYLLAMKRDATEMSILSDSTVRLMAWYQRETDPERLIPGAKLDWNRSDVDIAKFLSDQLGLSYPDPIERPVLTVKSIDLADLAPNKKEAEKR